MAEELRQVESLDFLPEILRDSLLDFQKNGIQFAIRNQGRCLVGDEMGLGKTLQALGISYYYKHEWPLLIVVPSSMKYPWIEEIEKWITDLEPGDINLIRSGTDVSNIPTSKINILGYGLCGDRRSSKLLVNALRDQAFKVVILDESHYLKNRNAGRTKLLHPIAQSAKRIILLTGTPSLARPEELYVQLDIVRPGMFGSFSTFATRYCEAHYEFIGKFRKWNTRGACNLDELHKRLHNDIMIRRLKKNVLTQLPPKRRQKITFDVPDSNYKQAGSIQQYISDLLDGMDNKFLVFCRHKHVITAVIELLTKKNTRYICIDGSVPAAVRGSLVNQFQTNSLVRVAVLAIEAASFGLTLTAADHVVFAELHYTPGIMMQAEDRAHRIGQVNAVNVHYLVGRGTLDEVLWGMLRRKVLHLIISTSRVVLLMGKLDELHAEEGDEETAKHLSACAAWLNDESEENDEDSRKYLFSQTAKKANKQIEGQRDLRSFLTPPSKTTRDQTVDSDEEMMEISLSMEKAHSSSSCNDSPVVTIEDSSEEEELCNEDDLVNLLVTSTTSCPISTQNDCTTSVAEKTPSSIPKSVSKDVGNHFYECSEYTDSEDIFQSYIPNDNDDEDGEQTLPVGIDEEASDSSSSTLTLSSGMNEESAENNTASEDITCESSESVCRVQGPEEGRDSTSTEDNCKTKLESKGAKSFQIRKRNPFSQKAKQKGLASLQVRKRLALVRERGTDSGDSDDDDFQTTMPKYSQEKSFNEKPKDTNYSSNSQMKTSSNNSSKTDKTRQNIPVKEVEERGNSTGSQDACSPWSCVACTFINDSEMVECSICLTVRTQGISKERSDEPGTSTSRAVPSTSSQTTTDTCSENVSSCNTSTSTGIEIKNEARVNTRKSISKQVPFDKDLDDFKESIGQWTCAACTLLNDAMLIECSVCMTPRRRSQRKTKSHWATSSCEKRLREKTKLNKPCKRKREKTVVLSRETVDETEQDVRETVVSEDESVSRQPSLTEGQCTQTRKRLQLEDQEHSLEVAVEEMLGDSEKVKEEVSNVSRSENGENSLTKGQSEALVDLETVEQTQDPFVLELSDSDATDDDIVNLDESGENFEANSPLTLDKAISTTGSTTMPSTDTERCNQDTQSEQNNIQPVMTACVNDAEHCNKETDSKQHNTPPEIMDSDQSESLQNLQEAAEEIFGGESEMMEDLQTIDLFNSGENNAKKFSSFQKVSDLSNLTMTVSSSSLHPSTEASSCASFSEKSSVDSVGSSLVPIVPSEVKISERSVKKKPKAPPTPMTLRFAMSLYTDRVYLYDENGTFLKCNFLMSDVKDNSKQDLPYILQLDYNFKQAKRMLQLWARLGVQQRRVVSKSQLVFKDPMDAYQLSRGLKKESTKVRHTTKVMNSLQVHVNFGSISLNVLASFGRSFVCSGVRSFGSFSFVQFFIRSFIHPFAHSFVHSFIHSLIHSSVLSSIRSSIRAFIRAFIHSFVRSSLLSTDLSFTTFLLISLILNLFDLKQELLLKNVQEAADEIGGEVRKVTKSPDRKRRKRNGESVSPSNPRKVAEGTNSSASDEISCMQAFGPDGTPMCLFCRTPVDYGSLGNNWDSRFCSFDCKENHQIRNSGTAVRRTLFDTEQGICQLCHFDAHACYNSVKALQKKDRRAFLEKSTYADLHTRFLNRMILDPKEGMFWEADHIVAVAEGGGQCGMENLRTLCVPCHKKVTKDLLVRLRTKRQRTDTTGSMDISAFLQPKK
ncbi:hypothetical protein QZH41_010969 [Actinostola sp. cb2023]|nr:hypothetical protein QZH41_010969 [Actinostola sp. cb2023]